MRIPATEKAFTLRAGLVPDYLAQRTLPLRVDFCQMLSANLSRHPFGVGVSSKAQSRNAEAGILDPLPQKNSAIAVMADGRWKALGGDLNGQCEHEAPGKIARADEHSNRR